MHLPTGGYALRSCPLACFPGRPWCHIASSKETEANRNWLSVEALKKNALVAEKGGRWRETAIELLTQIGPAARITLPKVLSGHRPDGAMTQ